jgi:hypothetical protein
MLHNLLTNSQSTRAYYGNELGKFFETRYLLTPEFVYLVSYMELAKQRCLASILPL